MHKKNKSLNNQQQGLQNKTAGKTENDYVPAKEKNPDDLEIIE